jgi:hypothetical protein
VRTTTYTLSSKLKQDLRTHLRTSPDYNLKQKSRWISEAICQLLAEDKDLGWVGLGTKLEKKDEIDKVMLTEAAVEALHTTMILIRRQMLLMEGVQSEVIRSAIRFRLNKENYPEGKKD